MSNGSKRKLSAKTYKEKYEIIKYTVANPGLTKMEIAAKFGIKGPILFDIMKNKQKVIDAIEKGETVDTRTGSVKRIKHVSFENVDSALIKWFRQVNSKPEIRVDGEMLLVKARQFAADLGYDNVEKISDGWIERFKTRYEIGKVLKAGESGGVCTEVVVEWKTGKLKDILKRYKEKDIFNADETGLFYLMLPENTLGFLGQSHHGTKESKVRITLLVAANMDGSEKLPMYMIGKSKNPRAFKNVGSLPVSYCVNKKAWMTSTLFDDWLKKLDRQMAKEKRKICMVIDNCPAHPNYEHENIELVFLPPGTTSHTQPMDGGVIKNFKFHYRRILATRRLDAAEQGVPLKWDLLDTLYAVKTAWGRVKQSTIANCFRSVGFVAENDDVGDGPEIDRDNLEVVEDEEETREFRNVWDRLKDFFGADAINDTGTKEQLTDAEIVESVRAETTLAGTSDGSSTSTENPPPTIHDAFKALDVLKRFALTVPECPSDIIDLGDQYENFLVCEMPKRMRQTTLDDFFRQGDK
uniref:HTH CENPB-type domain-containing protein n=1 Tax=Paramormyrops kingsleyae TaxID=1676925 RepID=A0A3B3SWE0_9TELE